MWSHGEEIIAALQDGNLDVDAEGNIEIESNDGLVGGSVNILPTPTST